MKYHIASHYNNFPKWKWKTNRRRSAQWLKLLAGPRSLLPGDMPENTDDKIMPNWLPLSWTDNCSYIICNKLELGTTDWSTHPYPQQIGWTLPFDFSSLCYKFPLIFRLLLRSLWFIVLFKLYQLNFIDQGLEFCSPWGKVAVIALRKISKRFTFYCLRGFALHVFRRIRCLRIFFIWPILKGVCSTYSMVASGS